MRSNTLRAVLPPLALVILSLAACSDDDPVSPEAPLWRNVELGLATGESRVVAVDFTGNNGLAMGLVTTAGGAKAGFSHEFFRLQPDGEWLRFDLDSIPADMVSMDLAVDTAGRAALAGFNMTPPHSILIDYRRPGTDIVEQASLGLLTVDCEGSFAVAGGRSQGGGLWSSTAPGDWNFDDLPLTGINDSGFRDVDIRGGRAVACGYDDGADTLQVILTRTAATGWQKIPAGGPYTATYYCIAQTDEGTIFVGGIEGAGGPSPRAFLAQRTADGLWTGLILPDPELLHGVKDILIAADGSIYLACMGEGDHTRANLIHAGPSGVTKEITPFPGGLLQVDQAADGNIYAVGFRRDEQAGTEEGVMLVRAP